MESGAWLVPEPSADPRMTTDTLTITDFILARVAEDEAVAEQVSNWDSHLAHELDGFSANAQRFARHVTPARVLAQCKATRAIVELHRDWPVLVETPPTFDPVDSTDISSMAFRATRQIIWQTEQEYRARFGDEPPTAPMTRALAAIWAGHEDYREIWNA